MKCHLMVYEEYKKSGYTDNDGLFCPLRKEGFCTSEEPEIEFNLDGVMWCVPRSKVTRRVLVGDETKRQSKDLLIIKP